MSTTVESQKPVHFAARAWQWLADESPVLAKEVLVTWRTPAYAGAIVAAPILITGIVLAVRWMMARDLDTLEGIQIVRIYLLWMAIFLGALGAILGSTLVVQDRENGTLEALRFSRVRASEIVFAKLASVLLAQLAIVVSTLPLVGYVAAASGVSLSATAVAAAMALGLGAMTAAVGIGASANAPNTRVALIVSLLGAAVIWMIACWWYAASWGTRGCIHRCDAIDNYLDSPFDRSYAVHLVGLPVCGLVLVSWGGIAAAISGLLDPSEDRSLPIKRWALAAVTMVAFAAWAAAAGAETEVREGIAGVALFVTALGALVLHFAFVSEPTSLSRRILARSPASILRRVLRPSLAASIGFTVVTSGLAFVGIPLLVRSPGLLVPAVWVLLYVSAIGGFMGFVAAKHGAQRARWLGGVASPVLLLALFEDHTRGPAPLDCVCPFWIRQASDGEAAAVWACSVALWALTACVMLGLMIAACRNAFALRKY